MSKGPYKATWFTQAGRGVNYYRAELPARYLPGVCAPLDPIVHRNEWVEMYQPGKQGVDGNIRLVRQKGPCAIWLFSGNTTRGLLMQAQRQTGIRVLMEVDDNYQVSPPNPGMSEWIERFRGTDEPSYEVHKWLIYNPRTQKHGVDGVICATEQLANEYRPLHPNVYVCPNQVDPSDWDDPPHKLDDGVLRVGWAASDSHWKDIELIQPAFAWLADEPDVEIVIMGIQWQRFYGFPFRHISWADDLAAYRRNLAMIDVMVCPLREGRWEDCKSDVKALEASMAGAACVVSRSEAYRPWWEREMPCLVAEDGRGFVKALRHLTKHRDEVKQLAKAAKEYVLAHRTIQGNIGLWRQAVEERAAVAA